jgi:plastocyanin
MHRVTVLAALSLAAAPAFAGGTIAGQVTYSGPAPKAEKIERKSDPFCAKTEAFDEAILLGKDGKSLQNVVVRLKNGPAAPVPAQPVTVDQNGCLYRPRVQGAVAGQKIEIRNDDPTLHNVHGYQGPKTMFNQAQPPKAPTIAKALPADGDVVKLKCDVHSWMVSYVVVSKGPFSTSGADGAFEIKDVPPGKYTVEAWHEKLGTQASEVTVEDGKTAQLAFAFAAK